MRAVHLVIEPMTPTSESGHSDVPYAIQVASPGPYADRDASGVRVAAWGAGLGGCCQHLVPNCCMATLCPCVSLAQIAARLGVVRFKTVLCGLVSVAIVQLLVATIAFAQVYTNDRYRRASGSSSSSSLRLHWYEHTKDPRGLFATSFGDIMHSNDDDDSAASTDDTTSSERAFSADLRAMATSPWGVLCLLLGLVYVFVIWRLRAHIRERFAIRGTCMLDCLVSLLLPCCAIAQMATHVKSYKPRECRFGPPDVLPAYPSLS